MSMDAVKTLRPSLTYGSLGNKGVLLSRAREEEGDVQVESKIGKLGSFTTLHISSSRPRR